jgi:hypothetical protein
MAALFSLTVDHRPFVQAEAAMEGCARRDRPAELPAEGETAGLRRVRQSDSDESVRSTQEAAVIDEFIGISQRDTGSRRPPPDGREAERIISEEKIFDGIALALLGALATRLDESIRAGLMRGAAGPPFRGAEHDLTGGLDAQSKRR